MPILMMQLLYTVNFIKGASYPIPVILISTTLLGLSWQFTQFIILLESVTLVVLYLLKIMPIDRTISLAGNWLLSMLLVWFLQYYPPFIVCSLAVSLLLALLVIMGVKSNQFGGFKMSNPIISGLAIFILTGVINVALKWISGSEDDGHIKEYFLHQLGIQDATNLAARIYTCQKPFSKFTGSKYIN